MTTDGDPKRAVTVEQVASARLPTPHGEFDMQVWRVAGTGVEHVALTMGYPFDSAPVLVRVHSECLTGDVFGSRRCDCGPQLDLALARIAKAGRGAVIYLRDHEGRGIGLAHKLRAYGLQDAGHDTVEANHALGFPADLRTYDAAAKILRALDIARVTLLTNNPAKVSALRALGIDVAQRLPHVIAADDESVRYLDTKRVKLGHLLPDT